MVGGGRQGPGRGVLAHRSVESGQRYESRRGTGALRPMRTVKVDIEVTVWLWNTSALAFSRQNLPPIIRRYVGSRWGREFDDGRKYCYAWLTISFAIALLFLCFGSFRMDRGYFEIFNKIVFLNLTIDSSTRHSVIASIFTVQFHPPNNQFNYFIIRFVYLITLVGEDVNFGGLL